MRRLVPVFVAVILLAGPGPTSAAGACRDACERYVEQKDLRAHLCGRCFLDADAGLWAEKLGERGSPAAEVLEKAIADEDWRVRAGAARGLARIERSTPERILCERVPDAGGAARAGLLETLAHLVRFDAAALRGACAGTGGAREFEASLPAATAELVARLSDRVFAVEVGARATALHDLSRLTGEGPGLHLARALAGRPAGAADRIAAEALMALARQETTPASRLLLADASPALQGAYDRILGVLGRQVAQVAAGLASTSPDERRHTVVDLALYGEIAREPLERALHADADWKVRWRAAQALGDARGATPELLLAEIVATSADEAERLRAAETLEGAATRGTAEAVLPLLGRSDLPRAVRGRLVRAAAQAGGPQVLPNLLPYLEGADPEDRLAAAEGLGEVARSTQVATALAERLTREDDALVRVALACSLVRVGRPDALAALGGMLERGAPDAARLAAVQCHERIGPGGGPGSAGRLAKVLEGDLDVEVRRAAASALGRIGGPQAWAALDRAMRADADASVRAAAQAARRAPGRR